MSLSDSMARLSEIGYSFSLDNDKIKFHYERSGEPPEEARGLLTEIKAHKEETVTLLRFKAGEPEPLSLETPVQPPQSPVAKMAPIKIFSRLFNEEIWLVADKEEMEALVSKGVKEVIYMAWEIPVLSGKDKTSLKAVHETKRVFPGAGLV